MIYSLKKDILLSYTKHIMNTYFPIEKKRYSY